MDSDQLESGVFTTTVNPPESNGRSSKKKWPPLKRCSSLDSVYLNTPISTSLSTDLAGAVVDFGSISPEVPLYLLQGDETSDEEAPQNTIHRPTTNDQQLIVPLLCSVTDSRSQGERKNYVIATTGSDLCESNAIISYSGKVRDDANCSFLPSSDQRIGFQSGFNPQQQLTTSNSTSKSQLCTATPTDLNLASALLEQLISVYHNPQFANETTLYSHETSTGLESLPPCIVEHYSTPSKSQPLSSSTQESNIYHSARHAINDQSSCLVTTNCSPSKDETVISTGPISSLSNVKDLLRERFMCRSNTENVHLKTDKPPFKRKTTNVGWTKGKKRKSDLELLKPPKPPLTSFGVFRRDVSLEWKDEDMSVAQLSKKLGQQWSKLSEDAKCEYRRKAEVDRNRFATELKHYLQQKLEGVSSLPMSVESLVMASFQCIDDPECMYCNICRLSFYNVSNKQAHFCGRPHTIELITTIESIVKRHKEGTLIGPIHSLFTPVVASVTDFISTTKDKVPKKVEGTSITSANVVVETRCEEKSESNKIESNNGISSCSSNKIDNHVRLMLRKKLLEETICTSNVNY